MPTAHGAAAERGRTRKFTRLLWCAMLGPGTGTPGLGQEQARDKSSRSWSGKRGWLQRCPAGSGEHPAPSSAPWPQPSPGAAAMRPRFLRRPLPGPGTSKTTAAFRAAPAEPSTLPDEAGGPGSPLPAAAAARTRDGSVTGNGNKPPVQGGARRSSQTSPCCLGCAASGGHSCTQTCISVGAGSAGWVPRVTWGSRRSPPAPSPCQVSPLSLGTPAELPALCCTASSHAWVDVGCGAPALCVLGWGFAHAEPGAPLWAPSHPRCGYWGCSWCQIQLSLRCQQA